MKYIRFSKRVLSLCLCAVLLLCGMPKLVLTTTAMSQTYEFDTTDVRAVLSAVLKGTEPDTALGDLTDRNADGRLDTTDVRTMLQEILSGNNTVTLMDNAFRLSSISDITDSTGTATYDVIAPYTDTYTLTCSNAKSIKLYYNATVVASGTSSVTASLTKGKGYTLEIKTSYRNTSFNLTTVAKNNQVTLPYDVATPINTSGFSLSSTQSYAMTATPINYQKRDNGTYVYCNNPEMIPYNGLGDAFIRNEGLTGEVYVTFEHSNKTGYYIYLGYQLKNEGDSDVFITVTNVGYQTSGSWYGQKAWYDFYNTSFCLPDDYFTNSVYDNSEYLFENYTPRVFQPITYRLPAGKSMYVVGGTTSDAYRNINVGSTANKSIAPSACVNAAVKFAVTGGSVTGTLYCYNRTSQVASNPAQTGYRVDNNSNGHSFGLQYQGIADHAGVIDSYFTWQFNDNIGSGMLPVSYSTDYDSNAGSYHTPYSAYSNKTYNYPRATTWCTHINPQTVHNAVGTDMVEFTCYDVNGVKRVIDNNHADGTGYLANTGNWMIEYQEHFTFVNQGSRDRKLILHYQDNGALAMLVRDSKTGNVIQADFPVGGPQTGYNYTYDVVVPAHSVKQITMDYLLMPMSAGTVSHMVTIDP